MLSVSKLTPGQEGYYERSVAAALDDYYAGRGESPGVWAGQGATDLGLEGRVEEGELGSLVRGRHPRTGEELRRHVKARTVRVERIDPESGARWQEQKRLAPLAGFDLVFSVPKSVSLLHALGDDETRRAVDAAHGSAWRAALAYLEAEACVTRRGKNGVRRERGGGFVAAAYRHRTSRAQDPHLHTHVMVANMTRSASDGEWRALDGEAILKTYRLAAGYLYEAQLRFELSRSLGVEWQEPAKGWAELRGIPRAVVDAFSRRRAQVVERLSELASSGFYAARVAAVSSREPKEEVDLPRLREEWRARAAEHGLGRRELTRLVGRTRHREPSPGELVRVSERLLGPRGLTEKQTTFSEPELVMAWAEAHAQGASVERIRSLAARLLALPGVERVGEPPPPGRPGSFTTSELLATERAALSLVERGRGANAPAVSSGQVDETMRALGGRLSAEQERLFRQVAASPDRVVCVVGLAGSGKTTAMRAAARAFHRAGIPVLGAAPSGIAAERLQDETGIPSTTLHRLLADRAQAGLPRGCLLVVDEAGMAETRVLAPLLELVERAHGKAVLVGDPRQLSAVGAGGLFNAIVERHGAIELKENMRQRDELERRALEAVRAGLGRDYVAFAEQRRRLVVGDSPVATRAQLLADWWCAARDHPAGSVMIALRRADVAELNAVARLLMDAEGRLGRERLTVAGLELATGDRIVCRRNADRIGVRNGTRAAVVDVEAREQAVTVKTDRGERIRLPRHYLQAGHVQHAYALTGHAVQGLTVERAFVLGADRGQLKEWGYVALSRARETTRVYVTEEAREPESHFREVNERDPATRLAQALEASDAETLATDERLTVARLVRPARPVIRRGSPVRGEAAGAPSKLDLLEQARRDTEKLRVRAEQRLAEAEQRLDGLGWRGRRRRAAELRVEIVFQRSALRACEVKLGELAREQERTRARLSLARERPPRVEPALAPELRPERQLSLDIDL